VVNIATTGMAGVGDYDGPRNMSFIRLPPARSGAIGPGAAGTGFTRMIAFRVLAAPKAQSAIWMATGTRVWGTTTSYTPSAGLWVNPDKSVSAVLMDGNHANAAGTRSMGTVDLGNWHIAFISVTADGTQWSGALDNAGFTNALSPAFTTPVGGYTDDLIGAATWAISSQVDTQYNFSGDVALAIEWPGVLGNDQIAAIVNAWRTGWAGDSAALRFSRILNAATWSGPSQTTSQTQSMAAATDLDGVDAATALQAVTDTEGGVMYCDAAGTVQLAARTQRWNPAPATVVFWVTSARFVTSVGS
jgi:hypothetical protein